MEKLLVINPGSTSTRIAYQMADGVLRVLRGRETARRMD